MSDKNKICTLLTASKNGIIRVVVTVCQPSSSLTYVKKARSFRALRFFKNLEVTDLTHTDTMSHFWIAEVTFRILLYTNRERLVLYTYHYMYDIHIFWIVSLWYQLDYNLLLTTDIRLHSFLVTFSQVDPFTANVWVKNSEESPSSPKHCSHLPLDSSFGWEAIVWRMVPRAGIPERSTTLVCWSSFVKWAKGTVVMDQTMTSQDSSPLQESPTTSFQNWNIKIENCKLASHCFDIGGKKVQ